MTPLYPGQVVLVLARVVGHDPFRDADSRYELAPLDGPPLQHFLIGERSVLGLMRGPEYDPPPPGRPSRAKKNKPAPAPLVIVPPRLTRVVPFGEQHVPRA